MNERQDHQGEEIWDHSFSQWSWCFSNVLWGHSSVPHLGLWGPLCIYRCGGPSRGGGRWFFWEFSMKISNCEKDFWHINKKLVKSTFLFVKISKFFCTFIVFFFGWRRQVNIGGSDCPPPPRIPLLGAIGFGSGTGAGPPEAKVFWWSKTHFENYQHWHTVCWHYH